MRAVALPLQGRIARLATQPQLHRLVLHHHVVLRVGLFVPAPPRVGRIVVVVIGGIEGGHVDLDPGKRERGDRQADLGDGGVDRGAGARVPGVPLGERGLEPGGVLVRGLVGLGGAPGLHVRLPPLVRGLGELRRGAIGPDLARGGEQRLGLVPGAQVRHVGVRRFAGDARDQFVEALGQQPRVGLLGRLVEPGQVGEQQPRVIAHLGAHLLAPEPHRLGRPVERPRGKRLRRHLARQHQRRLPPGPEHPIPPPREIARLVRQPDARRRCAHVPGLGKVMQERRLARGCPGVVVGGGLRE